MDGLLLIDKPEGLTSHDVVYRVRRRGRFKKVGHTGTLDPFATGVLPLCIGRATRLAGLLLLEDKGYDATLRLGICTDTLDREGAVVAELPVDPDIDAARIESVLARFRGPILQRPPMYSAVKVQGKALYRYAREGVEIERAERQVTIHRLELLSVTLPAISIRVLSSKGTYVRVLAQEIGEALGTGAHLTALRRTATGPFTLAQAITLEAFDAHLEAGTLEQVMLPMTALLPGMPVLQVSQRLAARIAHGNAIALRDLGEVSPDLPPPGPVQILCGAEMLALGEVIVARSTHPATVVVQPRTVLASEG